MNRATQTMVGAGVGYLVGRHRKLRLVLVLGSAVAAGRISGNQRGLLGRGAKALGGSAELSRIADLGAPLVSAARTAATSAVTRRIDSASAGLRERADLLRGPGRADADEADEPRRDRTRNVRTTTGRGRQAETDNDEDGEEFDAGSATEADRRDPSERRARDRRGPAARRRRPEPRDAGGDDDPEDDDLDPDDLDEDDPADLLAEDDERESAAEAPRRSTRRRTTEDAPPVRRRAR
jgi:hypothetical protein